MIWVLPMVQLVLRVNIATVFKLRPEPNSLLQPNEMVAIASGNTYPLHSYAYANINGSFNGHIKFALQNRSINGFNTWFVSSLDAQVEADGVVVYPHEDQESIPVLWINQNTILKRRPVDSSLLSNSERVSIQRGRMINLHSYAFADAQGDFNNHIKFAIRDRADFINGLSTWFVFNQHAFVTFDGDVVYPPEDPNAFILRITQNTLFKRRPVPSSQLAPNEQAPAIPGTLLVIDNYAFADAQGSFNSHIKFAIKYVKDNIYGFNTWYVFDQHARVEQAGRVVYPRPQPTPPPPPLPPPPPPPPQYTGRPFRLPGYSSTFYTDQPIIPNGNFTWGEATKNATRIPATKAIADNILALARELQKVRNKLGRPFQVNSWYRPPDVNSAVGGATNSQHLYGKAVDVQVQGMSGRQVANAVMLSWNGGIGIYSNMPSVIHLDIGPKRTWGF